MIQLIAWFIASFGTTIAAADDATLGRFRYEYPEAAKRIEAVYGQMQLKLAYAYSRDGAFIHRNHVTFLRDGYQVRYEHERVTPSPGVIAGHTETMLLTSQSFFQATRDGPNAKPVVIGNRINEASWERHLMACFDRQRPSPFDLFGVWTTRKSQRIIEFANSPGTSERDNGTAKRDLSLVDAITVLDSEKELVQLHWIATDGSRFAGTATLDPSRCWIVVAADCSIPFQRSLRLEFEGDRDGVPLLRRGQERTVVQVSDGLSESRWDLEVESILPGAIDPAEFDTKVLGTDSPTPFQPTGPNPDVDRMFPPPPATQHWYHWAGLVLVLSIWIIVRRARKRRSLIGEKTEH